MTSQERKDLIRIGELLNIHGDNDDSILNWTQNKTDLELLKCINQKLDQLDSDSEVKKLIDDEPVLSAGQHGTIFWEDLSKFNDLLKQDYTNRRQMLLERLDRTVESFKWKQSNDKKQKINQLYDKIKANLKSEPEVTLSHLLATKSKDCDRLLNGVVSSARSSQTIKQGDSHVELRKVIISEVPDRGGRAEAARAPRTETFSQQQKRGRQNRGRSGGRRARG